MLLDHAGYTAPSQRHEFLLYYRSCRSGMHIMKLESTVWPTCLAITHDANDARRRRRIFFFVLILFLSSRGVDDDDLQVERFGAKGLKNIKREDAQGRLNLEMAKARICCCGKRFFFFPSFLPSLRLPYCSVLASKRDQTQIVVSGALYPIPVEVFNSALFCLRVRP